MRTLISFSLCFNFRKTLRKPIVNFKNKTAPNAISELSANGEFPERLPIEKTMIELRNSVLQNSDSSHFSNLDMVKSNFINSRVRPNIGSNEDLMLTTTGTQFVGSLDKTLNLFEAPKDLTVWRAFSINDYGSNIENADEFLGKFFHPDRQTRMPVYMSTSFDRKISERFLKDNTNQVLAKINVPKGTKCVSMEELTPGDVYGNEHEVLFPRNVFINWKSFEETTINGKKYHVINMEASTPKGFNSEIKEYEAPKAPELAENPLMNLEELFKNFG
jgi:hypothetical protein